MPFIDILGARLELAHVPAGADAVADRPALVFLHEGLGSVGLWHDWPARLCAATGRTGWLYSRQGYGRSSSIADVRGPSRQHADGSRSGRLRPDYLEREALEVLPRVLKAMDIRQPVLVGHSDGATIALIHAAHHPVSACVVMAPHLMVEDITLAGLRQARQAWENGPLQRSLARHHDAPEVAFWQWNEAWLDPGFHGFDIRETCSRIRARLLAIQGHDDAYGSMAQLDELARVAPQTRRLKLADCGHEPQREQAQQVTRAIAEFLARLPSDAVPA